MVGFSVRASDGDLGKVDSATMALGVSEIVINTGPWILGRQVVLPAGTIERVDWENEVVYIDLTQEQIKGAPELTTAGVDRAWRERLTYAQTVCQ